MEILLWKSGHQVTIARTGLEGLKAAREEEPDIMLLDLGLPDMNGYELAKCVNDLRPKKTPLIIAVTGYGTEADRERSAEAGVDLHLVTPVDPVPLEGILGKFQGFLETAGPSGNSGSGPLLPSREPTRLDDLERSGGLRRFGGVNLFGRRLLQRLLGQVVGTPGKDGALEERGSGRVVGSVH
jgi:CheY-like chemotaxis protein